MRDISILLVVEDETAIRNLLVAVLEGEGYVVAAAADGDEGWDLLKRKRPALVLLDLQMPRMNGSQFLDKAEAEGISVPIIIMSAGTKATALTRSSGPLEFLRKPFEITDLLDCVAKYVPPQQ